MRAPTNVKLSPLSQFEVKIVRQFLRLQNKPRPWNGAASDVRSDQRDKDSSVSDESLEVALSNRIR